MKLSVRVNYILLPVIFAIFSLAGTYAYFSQKSILIASLTEKLRYETEYIIRDLQKNQSELKGLTDLFLNGMEVTRFLNGYANQEAIIPLETQLVRYLDGLYLSYGGVEYFTLTNRDGQSVFHYHLDDPFSVPYLSDEQEKHSQRIYNSLNEKGTTVIQPVSYYLEEGESDRLKLILFRSFSPEHLLTDNRYSASVSLFTATIESQLDLAQYRQPLQRSFSNSAKLTILPGGMVTSFDDVIVHHSQRTEDNALQLVSGNAFVSLQLSLPERYIEAQALPYLKAIISLVINISLLTFILLKVLINRQIIKPVSLLTKTVENALTGDASGLKKIDRRDEIASLNNNYVELFQSLHQMAKFDDLTGLANRNHFNALIDKMVEDSLRYQRKSALLYIDLDNFKSVNDNYGHDAGDMLLQEFASRMGTCLAQELTGSDTAVGYDLARLAGDEFAVLLHNPDCTDTITHIAQRMTELCRDGFFLNDTRYNVHVSIGIALCPDDGLNADALLKCADSAMYQMKRMGKNGYQFYSPAINEEQRWHLQIEKELKLALQQQLFYLQFMPVYDCRTGQIRGAEALLRADSELLAACGPAQFIPVAETSSLIREIDYWVIESALIHLRQLIDEHQFEGFISVNFSARELKNSFFAHDVSSMIKQYAIPPQQLELELTETCLVNADEHSIQMLQQLKKLGVRLSLDDFGTGYTAFTQLTDYPVDVLKIDRCFVNAITRHFSGEKLLIDIMVELASLFNLRVIAEGVETQQELDYVRKIGCEQAQGYFLSRPLDWHSLIALLHSGGGREKFVIGTHSQEYRLRGPSGSASVERRDRLIIIDYRGIICDELIDYVLESIQACVNQIRPATWGAIIIHDDFYDMSPQVQEKLSNLLYYGLDNGCVDAAYIIRSPDIVAQMQVLRENFGLSEDIGDKLFDSVDKAGEYLRNKLAQADRR